jgi:glycosyltransferase involved in cell wall biosynthesis
VLEGRRIAVVVPAYDEERLVARTLRAMPACVDEIVVVDDGSTDRTRERARSVPDARIRVIVHEANRGVGAAIATGYRDAFRRHADLAVVMGADGQMDPEDLPALALPVVRGEADYVKGNRLAHDELRAMPVARRVGNTVFSALTRAATGLSISDSQCGYTALSRTAAARLDLARLWPRYGYPNDLLARCARAGLRVRDVTVRPVYGDEESGIGLWEGLVVIPSVIVRSAVVRYGASPLRAAELDPAE